MSLAGAEAGGTFFICNESNGDTDKDEKWTKIINGMTIYQGTELKAYLEQAGFHECRYTRIKQAGCASRHENEVRSCRKKQRNSNEKQ